MVREPASSSSRAQVMLLPSSNRARSSTRTVTDLPFSAAAHRCLMTADFPATR